MSTLVIPVQRLDPRVIDALVSLDITVPELLPVELLGTEHGVIWLDVLVAPLHLVLTVEAFESCCFRID